MTALRPKTLALAITAATSLMAGNPLQAYESPVHVFSIDDVLGGFDGATYGPEGASQDTSILCIPADNPSGCPVSPIVDKEGITLYPIDSEFGFEVVDFLGARAKVRNNDYREGYAGNITEGGSIVGIKISNAATDTYKVKPPLGTWCQGLGGNAVKCSTEHYTVMEHVVSCHEVVPYQFADPLTGAQQTLGFPDDPALVNCASEELDNDIRVISGGTAGEPYDPLLNPMAPNDNTSVLDDIATSSDYSITLKDDGKVLYRWGSLIKRPNDVRLYARLPLPDAWKVPGADFVVKKAELHVTHWITNNPNDQLRPEDLENEGATGRTPDYQVSDVGGDAYWLSTRDCYEGDGDFISGEGDQEPTALPEGTVLRNGQFAFPDLAAGDASKPQNLSADLDGGYSNAFYTTTNRDPFEWSYRLLDGDGNGVVNGEDDLWFTHVGFPTPLSAGEESAEGLELVSGPRWRLKANKFGQDIPGLEIPKRECSAPPFGNDNIKYEVGELVTTVINLLDWEDDNPEGPSPLRTSKGWVDVTANDFVSIVSPEGAPPVTSNGLPMSEDFDLAVYVKGDRKPTAVLNAKLVIDYEGETFDSKLANGSARAEVGSGLNAIVGGFIIDGTEEKCVVLRGRGSSIGIATDKLADPSLMLMAAGSTTTIDSNDNWGEHPEKDLVASLGLAPSDPNEAALYTCLEPGAYVAELTGAPESELGLGMFEVFDVDESASKLVNISARAEVGNGIRKVVSGFIIKGDQPRDILLRGRGPSLRLSESLKVEDTFIELWEGSTIRAFNDDWVTADNADDIIATGKAPTNDKEGAILITLDPGVYTVNLSSATGEPGIGIVEVLDLTDGPSAALNLNLN